MNSHRAIAVTLLFIGSGSLTACGDDDTNTDAGNTGDSGPESRMDGGDIQMDAMPPPFVPPTVQPAVTCGGTACTVLTMAEVSAGIGNCCTDADACGITTALSGAACLPSGALGGADPSCPNLVMDMTMGSSGCCTPEGECGAILAGAGCIANGALMQPEQSCTYDPDNMCTRIMEVTCDGAEDCADGQLCCGQYAGGYRRTTCAADCVQEEIDQGGTWAQICHPGDTCVDPAGMGYACLASAMLLPEFLLRCRAMGTEPVSAGNTEAGMINCGLSEESADGTFRRQTCGIGEKCCISYPGEVARCVAADGTCPCDMGGVTPDADAGTEDAG